MDSAIPQMPVDRCRVAPSRFIVSAAQMLRTRGRILEFPQTHLDRLLHRCVVLTLDGDSYRLRDHQHEPESGGLAYAAQEGGAQCGHYHCKQPGNPQNRDTGSQALAVESNH